MIINADDLLTSLVDEGLPLIGWHNLVTVANIVSTTEDDDFPITNTANPATHLKWKGGINTGGIEHILVTTGYTGEIDYVGIAKHNLGTEGYAISIDQGDSPLLFQGEVLPDDSPVIFRFTPQVLSDVRVTLVPTTQTVNPPEIAVIYVGKLLIVERSIKIDADHVPISLGRRTTIVNGMSESGNFVGRVVRNQFSESRAEFSHITPDWYRANFDDFVQASKNTPFFWAWSPYEYPNEVGYSWLTKDAIPEVSPVTRRVSIDLDMRGIV